MYSNSIIMDNGILFSYKKESWQFVTTWMDLEGIMLNKIKFRQRNTNTV